jgi:undecaprenyl-diphosphatase
MPIEQLILLAIIQGLTEFLPISSSAHLILVPALTEWEDQGVLMDVAVHVGSLFAVMLYFRRDVGQMAVGLVDGLRGRVTEASSLLGLLVAATIPVVIFGGVLYVTKIYEMMRSAELIAWMTIVFAFVILAADRIGLRVKRFEDVTLRDAFIIGLFQCVSLIPGTSRSGITLAAARLLGYERSEGARFCMLMSIPVIIAFGLVTGVEIARMGDVNFTIDIAIATVLSFLSAFAAIWFFMSLVDRIGLMPFVIYRLILGAGLMAYVYL